MNVHEVLIRCRDMGVILAASPDGKLPLKRLVEELNKERSDKEAVTPRFVAPRLRSLGFQLTSRNPARSLPAIQDRQLEIEEHEIRRLSRDTVQRFLASGGFADVKIAPVPQPQYEDSAIIFIVLDHQDFRTLHPYSSAPIS